MLILKGYSFVGIVRGFFSLGEDFKSQLRLCALSL